MEIKKGKTAIYASLVTPRGILTGFSALFVPSTKFNKEGVYNADILLNEEDGKALYEAVKEVRTMMFKEFKKEKTDSVVNITAVKPVVTVDEETGETTPDPEGKWILKTKAKAEIKEGKATKKIAVFDAKGKPVKSCRIGAGSTVKLKLDLYGYRVAGKIGVSVKLLAVQIIDLVEYQGGNAEATFDGFEVEEGYEFDENAVVAETETSPEPVAEDDDNWEQNGF